MSMHRPTWTKDSYILLKKILGGLLIIYEKVISKTIVHELLIFDFL